MKNLDKLQDLMRDVFDDDNLLITPDTKADDIDDWDSLTHISLIVAIEKQFSIKFSHGEIQNLNNVGEFLNLVNSKLSV